MTRHTTAVLVAGPWSLATSHRFWEGFTPAALPPDDAGPEALRTRFLVDTDWSPAAAVVSQTEDGAVIELDGDGDLDAAARQVARFLALDVDGTAWPGIADRDPVLAEVRAALPGLRPCGFFSPYEAAVWSVLSQRIRMSQAARLQRDLVAEHGVDGAMPPPAELFSLDLDLPGRKPEYVRAVAEAALDGALDGAALRAMPPDEAIRAVQEIKGLGPFAAELVVLRGANAPDAVPRHEARLQAIVADRYSADAPVEQVAEAWRPLRTWGAFHLRQLGEAPAPARPAPAPAPAFAPTSAPSRR